MATTKPSMQTIRKAQLLMLSKVLMVNMLTFNHAVTLIILPCIPWISLAMASLKGSEVLQQEATQHSKG